MNQYYVSYEYYKATIDSPDCIFEGDQTISAQNTSHAISKIMDYIRHQGGSFKRIVEATQLNKSN